MRTPLTTLLIRDGTAYFVYDIHRSFSRAVTDIRSSILFLSKVAIIISNILPPAPNPVRLPSHQYAPQLC